MWSGHPGLLTFSGQRSKGHRHWQFHPEFNSTLFWKLYVKMHRKQCIFASQNKKFVYCGTAIIVKLVANLDISKTTFDFINHFCTFPASRYSCLIIYWPQHACKYIIKYIAIQTVFGHLRHKSNLHKKYLWYKCFNSIFLLSQHYFNTYKVFLNISTFISTPPHCWNSGGNRTVSGHLYNFGLTIKTIFDIKNMY